MTYRMIGMEKDQDMDFDILVATHPAQPGTFLVYAFKEDTVPTKTPVVLWGVLQDGTPVPITLNGVWDGVDQRNHFVLFPSGHCGRFEQEWETIEQALEALRGNDESP